LRRLIQSLKAVTSDELLIALMSEIDCLNLKPKMENKTKMYEAILQCPFNDALDDCAFNCYRNMSIVELINTTHQMDIRELGRLMAYHNDCVNKRKSNKLAS
jgi:hypothetical protein